MSQEVKIKSVVRKVNKLFPSCKVIMQDSNYPTEAVLHPMQQFAFQNSQQWEGVAMSVNNMLAQMQGLGLYSYYDFDNKSRKGSASLYDAQKREYLIEGLDTFEAIIKIMFMSLMGIPFTDKQQQAYYELMEADRNIAQILD